MLLVSSAGDLDCLFNLASVIQTGVLDTAALDSLVATGSVAVIGEDLFGSGTFGFDLSYEGKRQACFYRDKRCSYENKTPLDLKHVEILQRV